MSTGELHLFREKGRERKRAERFRNREREVGGEGERDVERKRGRERECKRVRYDFKQNYYFSYRTHEVSALKG